MKKTLRTISAVSLLAIAGCSGGGGDDGGSGSGGGGRSTKTGLRLVHAAIDETPLTVEVDNEIFTSARFGEPTFFRSVKAGTHLVKIYRGNSPAEVLRELSFNFAEDTEYSLLVAGEAAGDRFDVQILAEPIARPDAGRGAVKLFHGYADETELQLEAGSAKTNAVGFANVTDPLEVPSGPTTVTVLNKNGSTVGTLPVTVPDRGEVAIVVSGSGEFGYVALREFTDLD